jgi:hypothetical protein
MVMVNIPAKNPKKTMVAAGITYRAPTNLLVLLGFFMCVFHPLLQ